MFFCLIPFVLKQLGPNSSAAILGRPVSRYVVGLELHPPADILEDAALYVAATDHWSITLPPSLQSLIVTNPLRRSSGLFLCRGLWTL